MQGTLICWPVETSLCQRVVLAFGSGDVGFGEGGLYRDGMQYVCGLLGLYRRVVVQVGRHQAISYGRTQESVCPVVLRDFFGRCDGTAAKDLPDGHP